MLALDYYEEMASFLSWKQCFTQATINFDYATQKNEHLAKTTKYRLEWEPGKSLGSLQYFTWTQNSKFMESFVKNKSSEVRNNICTLPFKKSALS